jgi:hypothetical protein
MLAHLREKPRLHSAQEVVRLIVDVLWQLADIAAAHEAMEPGDVAGKILVEVS